VYELSVQQKSRWERDGGEEVWQALVEVRGPWSSEERRAALERVVQNNESFRTSYVEVSGLKYPVQNVETQGRIAWSEAAEINLEQEAALLRESRDHIRVAVKREAADHQTVLVSIRGLSADEATVELLLDQWSSGDGAEESTGYAQFSAWQKELEKSPEGEAYWAAVKARSVPLQLPFDGNEQRGRAMLSHRLSERIAQSWQEYENPAAVLLAVWQHILWRLTGEKETAIAVRLTEREFEELRNVAGPVEKWAPLTWGSGESLNLGDAARDAGSALHAAEGWSADLEESNECVVSFAYRPRQWSAQRGLMRWELEHLRGTASGWKICLVGVGGRQLELHYDRSALTEESAERLLGYVECGLGSGLADLLNERERSCLLQWSGDPGEGQQPNLLERIQFHARLHGTRLAVVSGHEQLTYSELNQQAGRLARWLVRRGVRQDDCVGLCVSRSVAAALGMWGIWKAGGAYVALDGEHPGARLRPQARAAGLRVMVSERKYDGLWEGWEGTLLYLDGEEWKHESGEDLGIALDAAQLAYVIYTSGSTGVPKGVGVSHGNLWNYVAQMERQLGIGADDHWQFASVTTLCADLGHTALWVGWGSGGTVHLVDYQVATDARHFSEYMSRNGVEVLKMVPSHLRALLASGADAGILPKRKLVLGGEALSADLVRRVYALRGSCQVMNHYGPTEATVGALTHAVGRTEGDGGIPLGKALGGVRAYVVDQTGQLAARGVKGELLLGGAGIARGYVGEAAQTAERFIPDAFSSEGGRLYRTGDLARWRPDGLLEYLGRKDQQVKLRGYRIELGEIESVLRRQEDVRNAAVILRQGAAGEPFLAAYVVPAAGRSITVEALRAWVAQSCPEYMMPRAFVFLDVLPLTSNGKLDLKALPAPAITAPSSITEPANDVEKKLAAIWSEVLHSHRAGLRDNFFELGGDSILSIQAVARARGEGIRITVRQLFEHPTIAELAAVAEVDDGKLLAEQGPVSGEVELTPIQRWFFDRQPAEPWHFNQSVLLEAREPLNVEGLRITLRALMEHHDALRTRFERRGNGWRQYVAAGVEENPLQVEAVNSAAELEQRAAEWQRRFDLTSGLLLRAVLFHLAGEADRLLLIAHHLVVDGVSWRILLEDIESGYEQWRAGTAIKFPAKTDSFQRWSEILSQHAASVEADLPYWVQQCSWNTHQDDIGAQITTVTTHVSEDETRYLLEEAPAVYGTQINDVLLTALVETAGDGGRVCVELESHGRSESLGLDITRTVGWFTAQFPVVLDFGGAQGIGDRLKAIKEQLRRVPGGGIGYGLLRYCAHDSHQRQQLLHTAAVRFNYFGQLDGALAQEKLFTAARESAGETRSRTWTTEFPLNVDAAVWRGKLHFTWTLRRRGNGDNKVHAAAARFLKSLRSIIGHCRQPGVGGYTPSDFPLAKLDQKQLDAWYAGRRQIEDIYPLSPMQQGLLFHSIDGASQAYISQTSCTLSGDIDPLVLERAWDLAACHAILRTSFRWDGIRHPLQIVHTDAKVPVTLGDWTHSDDKVVASRWEELLRKDRVTPFDLAAPPLMRVQIIRIGGQEWRLVWTYHHLIMDGWSGPMLLGYVFRAYHALLDGRTPDRVTGPRFSSYIAWLQCQNTSDAEAFWRNELRKFRTPSRLARDTFHGAVEYASEVVHVASSDFEAVHSFARQHRVTLNTLAQAAWALLLSRASEQKDVVYGLTSSGRPAEIANVDKIVGPCINTVPMRVRIIGDRLITEWLTELHESAAAIRQFEYAPLSDIQSWSELPRGVPLFDTVVAFQNFPVDETLRSVVSAFRIGNVRMNEHTNYALALLVTPAAELTLRANYDRKRLPAVLVKRLLRDLEYVLNAIGRGVATAGQLIEHLQERDKQYEREMYQARHHRLRRSLKKLTAEVH
jgi:amino acid adenylation domain-containing protein/non-ribosomal peptide synthase protein (TIGR01720 family)